MTIQFGQFSILHLFGLSIIGVPIIFLLIFLVGETVGGDISGLGHLVQLLPILILLIIAWKFPFAGGILFTSIGLVLGIMYAISAEFPLETILIVEAVLFLPLVITGISFILASRKHDKQLQV